MAETKAIVPITQEISVKMNEWIKDMVNTKQVRFPANYSPENALKAAMFILADAKTGKDSGYKPVMEACSKGSIYYALQKMLTNGLNPAKNQCYFIPYGTKLDIFISYFGYVGIAKSAAGIKEVSAQVIYEDDVFEYGIEHGKIKIYKHEQKLGNINPDKIVGTYAVVSDEAGKEYIELMNMDSIKKSWSKSTYGINQKTHGDFKEEMAKRTVIRKSLKMFVNSSNDSNLFIEDEPDNFETVREDIKSNSTGELIDIAPMDPISEAEVKHIADAKEAEAAEPTAQELFGGIKKDF